MDNEVLNGSNRPKDDQELPRILEGLRDHARATNENWAALLGIQPSTAITCVKPSGTVSQLVDSASGIHPRYSNYYIRTIRQDIKDPITQFLISQGIPHEPCVMKPESTVIFSFPQKAPDGAVTRNDRTALEQLELWLVYQRHFCEHKPSITVYVKEDEWIEVGAWVYKYFDEISGISFLPHSDHTYQQAPYQECTEQEYLFAKERLGDEIDWNLFIEETDNTEGSQTLACQAGQCEI